MKIRSLVQSAVESILKRKGSGGASEPQSGYQSPNNDFDSSNPLSGLSEFAPSEEVDIQPEQATGNKANLSTPKLATPAPTPKSPLKSIHTCFYSLIYRKCF